MVCKEQIAEDYLNRLNETELLALIAFWLEKEDMVEVLLDTLALEEIKKVCRERRKL